MALNNKEKEIRRRRAGQGRLAENVLPDDSIIYESDVHLYVGKGGNLYVETTEGQIIVLMNVQDGTFINWIKIRRIINKGTTAQFIVAIH